MDINKLKISQKALKRLRCSRHVIVNTAECVVETIERIERSDKFNQDT